MTAFKLTFAASVLALGGLAACGALIFAAEPPGGPRGAPDMSVRRENTRR